MDISTSAAAAMDWTGERMVPENSDQDTFWAHAYRYAFAAPFARGLGVLDIACGEGYGSAALQATGARSVIGVDISEAACQHAARKYGIDARVGRAEQIPLRSGCVDLVVSFETIEHVADPSAFLDECRRVLVPGGRLIISTPNKLVYARRASPNPYHCSEMTEGEFHAALVARFARVKMYTQSAVSASRWSRHAVSAEQTPWMALRGFYRLRRFLQSKLEGEMLGVPTAARRASVVDLIVEQSRRRDNLLNPYRVRPRSRSATEDVLYFIAVADQGPGRGA